MRPRVIVNFEYPFPLDNITLNGITNRNIEFGTCMLNKAHECQYGYSCLSYEPCEHFILTESKVSN